jgi:hypothetical protein
MTSSLDGLSLYLTTVNTRASLRAILGTGSILGCPRAELMTSSIGIIGSVTLTALRTGILSITLFSASRSNGLRLILMLTFLIAFIRFRNGRLSGTTIVRFVVRVNNVTTLNHSLGLVAVTARADGFPVRSDVTFVYGNIVSLTDKSFILSFGSLRLSLGPLMLSVELLHGRKTCIGNLSVSEPARILVTANLTSRSLHVTLSLFALIDNLRVGHFIRMLSGRHDFCLLTNGTSVLNLGTLGRCTYIYCDVGTVGALVAVTFSTTCREQAHHAYDSDENHHQSHHTKTFHVHIDDLLRQKILVSYMKRVVLTALFTGESTVSV